MIIFIYIYILFNKIIVFYILNHYVKYYLVYLILYKDLLFFSQKISLLTDAKYFSTFKQTLCTLILIMWAKMSELNRKNIFC